MSKKTKVEVRGPLSGKTVQRTRNGKVIIQQEQYPQNKTARITH